jgi:hypothetical protein
MDPAVAKQALQVREGGLKLLLDGREAQFVPHQATLGYLVENKLPGKEVVERLANDKMPHGYAVLVFAYLYGMPPSESRPLIDVNPFYKPHAAVTDKTTDRFLKGLKNEE